MQPRVCGQYPCEESCNSGLQLSHPCSNTLSIAKFSIPKRQCDAEQLKGFQITREREREREREMKSASEAKQQVKLITSLSRTEIMLLAYSSHYLTLSVGHNEMPTNWSKSSASILIYFRSNRNISQPLLAG